MLPTCTVGGTHHFGSIRNDGASFLFCSSSWTVSMSRCACAGTIGGGGDLVERKGKSAQLPDMLCPCPPEHRSVSSLVTL